MTIILKLGAVRREPNGSRGVQKSAEPSAVPATMTFKERHPTHSVSLFTTQLREGEDTEGAGEDAHLRILEDLLPMHLDRRNGKLWSGRTKRRIRK